MSEKISENIFRLVKPIAEGLGLELVEVEYVKKHDGMNLTVYIDKEGGVTIDDCEALHMAIDAPLDELNPTNDAPYILNVSSLGLDRPLKTDRDFKRNTGKEISVKLYAPDEGGKKKYDGILKSYDGESFTVELEGGEEKKIMRKQAAHIEPIIRF